MAMDALERYKRDGFKGEQMIVPPIESFQNYIEHPLVQRMYLTDVGYFPNAACHFRERKEGIEENILIYCSEGKGHIFIGSQEYVLDENEALCIPSCRPHRYFADEKEPWSILWVHFKGTDTAHYPIQDCKVIKFLSPHATSRMHYLFDLLFRVLQANYTLGNFIYISNVLNLILSEVYDREKQSTNEQNRHITNIIRYMSQNLDKRLTLCDLEETFELSRSYLNAIFQKATQRSPLDFFINMKIRAACTMLRTTDMYVYEVAQKLGYNDQYYFSRIFKSIVGVPPKEYKNGE